MEKVGLLCLNSLFFPWCLIMNLIFNIFETKLVLKLEQNYEWLVQMSSVKFEGLCGSGKNEFSGSC